MSGPKHAVSMMPTLKMTAFSADTTSPEVDAIVGMRDASKFLGESVDPEDPMSRRRGGDDDARIQSLSYEKENTGVTKSYVIENSRFEDLDDQRVADPLAKVW